MHKYCKQIIITLGLLILRNIQSVCIILNHGYALVFPKMLKGIMNRDIINRYLLYGSIFF